MPVPTVALPLTDPFDPLRTFAPLVRGPGDRTIRVRSGRVWWTTRTPDGAATLMLRREPGRLVAEAWGPGDERVLAAVPAIAGVGPDDPSVDVLRDDPDARIARLARRFPGVRLTRTGAVLDALIPAILEQKVTGSEAHRAWNGLVRRYGEPAPGHDGGTDPTLRLPPPPDVLAKLPYHAYHPFGIERRRADLIRAVASRASWFEAIVDLPPVEAQARLRSVPGIGPWTAAEVAVRALGDPDAVSVGDFHLPHLVAYALAGEPRGTDERMLELLAPWHGRRALVVRLIELSGIRAPRYGPRLTPRRIESI
jgi:3-methyladenine DNA glycosylase/8-oxoguanine DNA glycosylase